MSAARTVIRVLRERVLHPLGVEVTRYPPRGALAVHLENLFAELGINCVLDVGAHHGEYALSLRRDARYPGRIVSFEPQSEAHSGLAAASQADRAWTAQNVALGAEDGERDLRVAASTPMTSLRSASAVGRDFYPGRLRTERVERVTVRRLDDVFEECIEGLADPRVFLKIDTQGWDLEVLRGSERVLPGIHAVQVELAVRRLYEGVPRYLEILEWLDERGFVPTGFFPVTGAAAARLIELDCVLTRST